MTVELVTSLIIKFLRVNRIIFRLTELRFTSQQILTGPMSCDAFTLLKTALRLMNIAIYRHPGTGFKEGTMDIIVIVGVAGDVIVGLNYNKDYYCDS